MDPYGSPYITHCNSSFFSIPSFPANQGPDSRISTTNQITLSGTAEALRALWDSGLWPDGQEVATTTRSPRLCVRMLMSNAATTHG